MEPETPGPAPTGPPVDEQTQASYRRAGFGQAGGLGQRPVLLIVDLCRAYFTAGSPLDLGRPEVAESVGRLVTEARGNGVPVVWTRVEYEPGGADGGVWYRKVGALASFDRGNPLGDWLPGLEPESGDVVVTKRHASGFFGTDLADRLTALGIDSVLVAGVSTSGCVRATATDASAWGLLPAVVREAVGDRTDAVHDANLFDLNAKYADVISEVEARAHIRTVAEAEAFGDR